MRLPSLIILLPLLVAAAPPPGQQPAPAANSQPTVLLIPFKPLSDNNTVWIADGIQQNLLNELSRVHSTKPIVQKSQTAVATPEEAANAGKNAAAVYALFGSYQISGDELRITAQLVNVASGKIVAGLRATGPMRDLFALEDSLAEQLKRSLAAEAQLAAAAQAPQQPNAAPAQPQRPTIQPNGPVRDPQGDIDDNSFDRARKGYDNPDYWDNRYYYGNPSYFYTGYYGYPYGLYGIPNYPGYLAPLLPTSAMPGGPRLDLINSVGKYPLIPTPPK